MTWRRLPATAAVCPANAGSLAAVTVSAMTACPEPGILAYTAVADRHRDATSVLCVDWALAALRRFRPQAVEDELLERRRHDLLEGTVESAAEDFMRPAGNSRRPRLPKTVGSDRYIVHELVLDAYHVSNETLWMRSGVPKLVARYKPRSQAMILMRAIVRSQALPPHGTDAAVDLCRQVAGITDPAVAHLMVGLDPTWHGDLNGLRKTAVRLLA